MNSEQLICMETEQDNRASSSADEECDAVRRFRSSNDHVKLKDDFWEMLRDDRTLVAELESVIDFCPDILMSFKHDNDPGYTPLHEACFCGRSYEVIELLVQRNPDALQIADKYSNLPLHQYLNGWDRKDRYPELLVIKLLVDTYPLSVQLLNRHEQTPLHYACDKGRSCSFEVIEYLVQSYPQALQTKDRYSHTPLHRACRHERSSKEIVALLIQQGPDVLQVADISGNLPLHLVNAQCELSVVKLMVDTYPLSVQVLNRFRQTPLLHACCQCSFEVIEYLVQLYPQALQINDTNNLTPLHLACYYGRSNEVIELLVQQNPGALQVADKDGNLPLHHLRQHCELSVIKLMIDLYPLSVQVQNKYRETPLHCACESGCSFDVIEYLVESYPQALQMKSKHHGHIPFHIACLHKDNNLLVIQLLHTAFPIAARWKNCFGQTLLDEACDANKRCGIRKGRLTEMIEWLAYECWPLDCLLLYCNRRMSNTKVEKCVEDVTVESVAALIDVAFHIKHILPDTVIAHIAQSVMLPSADKSKTVEVSTELCSGHCCVPVLDKSGCCMNLDRSTLLSVLENEEIQCLLETKDSHDKLQELIDNVIRMNRAGRAYFANDPENKQQGMKVLHSTATGLNGLFYHLRENPLVCKRCQRCYA